MKKLIFLLGLVLCLMGISTAQITFSELSTQLSTQEGHDKLVKQGLVRHAYTFTKWPAKYYIEKPFQYKRVGLISVMVKQNDGVSTQTGRSFSMGEGTLQLIATELSDALVGGFKTSGEEQGITILTPEEFLATDALKEEYLSMQLEGGPTAKGVVQALGYRAYPKLTRPGSMAGPGGVKFVSFHQLGALAQKCELDALVIAVVNVYPALLPGKERKMLFYDLALQNILINQTPVVEGRKYPKLLGGYMSCIGAGYSLLSAGGTPILEFYEKGKGEILTEDFQVLPSGGIRTSVTRRPELQTTANFLDDFSATATQFSRHYLQQVSDLVVNSNQKNKLE